MLNHIRNYFIILFICLIIDIPMITMINNKMYNSQLYRINNMDIIINNYTWLFGAITYILLAIAMYHYIIKPVKNSINIDYIDLFIQGGLLGFIIYGVYNGTNKITINNWGVYESAIDTIWGTLLLATIPCISLYIIKYIDR